MQLILRADVDNLGRLGETVTVKPGYGRNYLVPQGLAMPATTGNLRKFEQERKKLQARMDAIKGAATGLADKLAANPVTIEVRVGEGDRLYGSVTSAMLADALAKAGVEIDRKKIVLDDPIRSLGEYEIEVRLHADVKGAIKLSVIRQGGNPEAEETPAATSEQPATEDE